jgi:predicted MFS family arabinose efflux permease
VLREGVSPNWALLAFGLTGVGLGLLLPNLTLFMQMMSQRRDVGVASAVIQTTRAIGSAAGIAAVGVVVSKTSVLTGIRIGLIGSLVCCVIIALLAMRIRMRNVP